MIPAFNHWLLHVQEGPDPGPYELAKQFEEILDLKGILDPLLPPP